MTTILTNTPRPGETAEQTAARTAPRDPPRLPPDPPPAVTGNAGDPRRAQYIILTDPEPGRVFVLAVQAEGDTELKQMLVSRELLLKLNADMGDILVRAFK